MTVQFSTRVLFLLVLLLALARPAAAQWPTVIMFYGGELKQPVFATGADTPPFSTFFGPPAANQTMTAKDMGDRPFVNVACFWGPRDEPAQNGVRNLAELKPEMTWQHGRFYPATAGKPAMMFLIGMAQVKGREAYGLIKNSPTMRLPVPTDPAVLTVGREVPAPALAVLQRLGVTR